MICTNINYGHVINCPSLRIIYLCDSDTMKGIKIRVKTAKAKETFRESENG